MSSELLVCELARRGRLLVGDPYFEGGVPVLHCPIDMGWATDGERATFRHYFSHQQEFVDPAALRLTQAFTAPQATVLRDEVIGDRDWYSSAHVQEIRRTARVDSFLFAFRACEGGRLTTISLHRPWNDRPFSPADRALCGDLALNLLDHEMRDAYGRAMEAGADPIALRESQAAWRRARDPLSDSSALASLYDRRIRELRAAAEAAASRASGSAARASCRRRASASRPRRCSSPTSRPTRRARRG